MCPWNHWYRSKFNTSGNSFVQDKEEMKDQQHSRDAVKSKKRTHAVSSSAEAEVEGEDEVRACDVHHLGPSTAV
jgi:hypothetical protein